jgi:hypothetical protein
LTGYIAEVCIFRTPLNNLNRQLIEGYLAWKWGLEANLPVSHPYKNSAPQAPTGIGGEVGWWCPSLDDAGNGTAVLNDLTGNSNGGTLTNMDPATDWVVDTSLGGIRVLDFSGLSTPDIVITQDSSILEPGSSGSLSGFVRFTTKYSFSQVIAKRLNSSVNSPCQLDINGSQLPRFAVSNGASSDIVTGPAISNGVWYHFCGTYDGTTIRLYIDGVEVANAPQTVTPQTGTGSYCIGNVLNTAGLVGPINGGATTGYIDDVRVFNRAITANEVALLASKRGYQPVSNTRRRRYAGSYGL